MSKFNKKDCQTCGHRPVCRFEEHYAVLEKIAERIRFDCRHYTQGGQSKPNHSPASGQCTLCGRQAKTLHECGKCHRFVCDACAEIEQELDINTGTFEEHTFCQTCAKGD